jgi:hypothetical protein
MGTGLLVASLLEASVNCFVVICDDQPSGD